MKEEGKELFIVPTPIGNLGDITFRAVEVLKTVDMILSEDTRTTRKLLNKYEISTRLLPYHAANEGGFNKERLFGEFNTVALVSESGTPCISDPGFRIVQWCHENNIRVTPLPGATAGVTLLSASGFPIKNFLFCGFLPNKKGTRKNVLTKILDTEKKTLIFYESPYRILHLLELITEYNPELILVVGRELTKIYEEIDKKKANEFLNYYDNKTMIKGEFVVIIDNNA